MIQFPKGEEANREKLKSDVLLFGRVVMPNAFTVPSPSFHHEVAEIYHEPAYNRVSIEAPRGHAKSTVVGGMFPLHHIMYEDGIKVVVLVSKTLGHAIKLLQTIKDVLNYSQTFRQLYGYWGMMSAKRWTEFEIELKDGSLITCRGASQQIVGLKHLNQRPTLVILDDPEDENNTKTKESMDNNFKVLMKGIVPGLDPKRGRVFVIGTPQKQGCMVEVLKDMPNWLTKHYDAVVDEATKTTLWPEWWPWDKLMREKEDLEAIGKLSIFYSEYRCMIIGDEDQLFRPEDMRYYRGDFYRDEAKNAFVKVTAKGIPELINYEWVVQWETLESPEIVPINVFMGIDPASSTRKTADYSVVFPIGVDTKDNIYCLPYFRRKVKPMQLADGIITWFKKYKPDKTSIETVGYQEMLRDYLKSDAVMGQGIYIPGLEIKNNPRDQKSARLETLEPFFVNHKVFILEGMTDFYDELVMYPRSKHDDLLDGFYYAKKKTWRPYHTVDSKSKNYRREEEPESGDWMTA